MAFRNKGEKAQKGKHSDKRTYTFIVAPNDEGRLHKVTLSRSLVNNMILIVSIFILAFVFTVISLVSVTADYKRSQQDLVALQAINKSQQLEIYEMNELAKEVQEKLVYLDLLETKINTILETNPVLTGEEASAEDKLLLNELNANIADLLTALSASGGEGEAYMNYFISSENMEDFDISEQLAELKAALTEADLSIENEQYIYEDLAEQIQLADDKIECYPDGLPLPQYAYRISGYFGGRSFPIREFHSGLDMACPRGTNIFAAGRGTVIFSGWRSGYGNCVIIDHGFGYETLYGHCSALACSVGDHVEKGDLIAYVGSTGFSTGSHLHFEVHVNGKRVNPITYIEATKYQRQR